MYDNNEMYIDHLTTAVKNNLLEMAGLEAEFLEPQKQVGGIESNGLTVIIGITGKRPGRIIYDMAIATGKKLSDLINGEEIDDQGHMIDTISELANIVSGHTISFINNANKGMGLMLSPPSIFFGSNLSIASPNINAQIMIVKTEAGELNISIGFENHK